MNTNTTDLNVKNLCSRKLWELLSDCYDTLPNAQKTACEKELLLRNHYLPELQQRLQQQAIR